MRLKCTFVAALIMFVVALLLTAVNAFCQKPHSTLHTDKFEQEEEIRLYHVTVTEKIDDKVYLYREGSKGIEVMIFFWDKQSVLKDTSKNQFKGCYLMLTCLKDRYIYWLQRSVCDGNLGGFYFKDS